MFEWDEPAWPPPWPSLVLPAEDLLEIVDIPLLIPTVFIHPVGVVRDRTSAEPRPSTGAASHASGELRDLRYFFSW